jgi:hypothetical protein
MNADMAFHIEYEKEKGLTNKPIHLLPVLFGKIWNVIRSWPQSASERWRKHRGLNLQEDESESKRSSQEYTDSSTEQEA